jgi:hypothetical protein
MKTKILIPGALLALLCATTQAQLPMTDNTAPPDWLYYQQAYLPGAVVEGNDTIGSPDTNDAYAGIIAGYSGNNDQYTYVSYGDRASLAQSFTTGSSPLGYALHSFTFQQVQGTNGGGWLNNGTYFLLANGDNVKVRVGSITGGPLGTKYTTILETNATYTGTTYNGGSTTYALGIYFKFDLSGANITLAANTTYFVEMMTTAGSLGNDHLELNNTDTNPISGTFPPIYLNGQALVGNTGNDLDRTGTFGTVANGGEFAFVASLTAVGAPTVVATANPSSAAAGQSFKVTATITQGVGTVTNVTVDLSGIAGSSAATLVRSNTANVYTNTFTVPNASPLGTNYLMEIATQNTQPLVGAARVAFIVFSASAPAIVNDVTPVSQTTLYVGEGILFSATFSGAPPISYQWQTSLDANTYTDIPGATNTTYTIPAVALTNAGYYQLQASNAYGTTVAFGGNALVYLNVVTGPPFPTYLWSAPIPFSGLNADQILTNFPGTKVAGALVGKNGGNPIIVTNSTADSPIVFAGAGAWATLSGGAGYFTGANTNLTGNANFNTCLNDAYDNNTPLITMSGLVLNEQYQVQLFGLDNRSSQTPAINARLVNYQDPNNVNDKAQNIAMSDNVYMLATFTATNTVMTIQENTLNTSSGNFNCLVLRAVGWFPPPYITSAPANVNGFLGTSSSLSGSAAGDPTIPNPAISYQWQAGPTNGPFTNLVAGNKYAITTTPTNTTLTISNLTAADGLPVYLLTAHNSGGYTTSRLAFVYAQAAPVPPAPGSYGAYALSNNPIGYWHLNETNDPSTGLLQAYDFTGNGNNGTYQAGAQNGYNGIMGPTNYPGFAANQGALFVNGNSSDVIAIPPLNTPVTGYNATIALWIDPLNAENTYRGIFYDRNSNTYGMEFGPSQSGGMPGLGYDWNNDGTWSYDPQLYMPVNTWEFAVVVIESNKATLYLDYLDPSTGKPVLKSAVNYTTATAGLIESFATGTTWIGGDPGNGNTITAYIADVALYNTNLSSSQVMQMFAAAVGVQGFPGLISLQPPANLTNYAGFTVQISSATGGNTPLTNQWKLNSTNLVDGNYGGAIVSGSQSPVLTIANVTTNFQGVFNLTVSNSLGGTVSSNAYLTVLTPVAPVGAVLVGQWLAGAQNFKDVSGYSPAGTHDGILEGGASYYFTNDVPPNAAPGNMSLRLNGNTAIAIANSSTLDAGYTNTYDVAISNQMTVTFWAKGWPGGWNPFVSKNGDSGSPNAGWDLRNDGNNNVSPCWTIRGNGGTVALGTAVYGNSEDLAATSISYNPDGKWHFYAGTYDVTAGQRMLYVDGALVAYTTGNGQYNTAPYAHVVIGGIDHSPGNSFTAYFTGLIYDVRIYGTALGPDNQAYVGQSTLPPPPTIGSSRFIPGVGGNPGQYVVSWFGGRLLEATNIAGPWVTNAVQTSPITNNATKPVDFFQVVSP